MSVAKHTLILMAGGTGGHIFPGLAVANYMRERGWEIGWLGNPADMEGPLVAQHEFVMYGVKFGGVRGKGFFTKLILPFTLLRAFLQSYRHLRTVRPNIVLGMGGYITFPGGLAARLLGIPLIIHEQNAVAGLANRLLAKMAHRVLCAFPNALPQAECIGNPVRRSFLDVLPPQQRYRERTERLRLLVVGGSRGATALNQIIPKALALIPEKERPTVIHQAGQGQLDELKEKYAELGVEVSAHAFIDDMAAAYSEADLVICRAGAMTVAEIAAIGVAALFVPFPFAVDDHQTRNAQFLVARQAALMVPQSQLSAENLAQSLRELRREILVNMAVAAKTEARPQATADIARICALVAMPGYGQP